MLAEFLVLAVFPGLLVAAACWDVASFTIPNQLQIGLLTMFAVLAIALRMPTHMLEMHVLAGGIGLAAGFTLFAFGFIGGGDAKLFACVALALGWNDLLEYALVASLFGGALTLGLLTMRKVPMPRTLVAQGWIMRLHDDREGIPYGVALALGALVLLPQTELFRAAIAG
jgi:prepilin peptidase CpaA